MNTKLHTETIESAIQARQALRNIAMAMRSLPFDADMFKCWQNVNKMVSELSKLEVVARQTQRFYAIDEYKPKLLKAIRYLEQIVLTFQLMK